MSSSTSVDDLAKTPSANDRLIRLLLEAQQREADMPEDAVTFIDKVVVFLPEDDLCKLGRELLRSTDVNRAILGTRLIRELPHHKADAAEALDRAWNAHTPAELALWILFAFCFVPGGCALDKIIASSFDSSPEMRDAAADAITRASPAGRLPDKCRKALIRLAHDEDREVQFSAVYEIGVWWADSHDGMLHDELERAARSNDPLVARTAIEALDAGQL